jgi:hypothetical protein
MSDVRNLILAFVAFGTLMGAGCPPRPTAQDMGPRADLAVMNDLAVPSGILACPVSMPLPVATDVCDGMFTVSDGSYYACVHCKAAGCMDTVDKLYCVVGSCTTDARCAQPPKVKRPPKPQLKRGK